MARDPRDQLPRHRCEAASPRFRRTSEPRGSSGQNSEPCPLPDFGPEIPHPPIRRPKEQGPPGPATPGGRLSIALASGEIPKVLHTSDTLGSDHFPASTIAEFRPPSSTSWGEVSEHVSGDGAAVGGAREVSEYSVAASARPSLGVVFKQILRFPMFSLHLCVCP